MNVLRHSLCRSFRPYSTTRQFIPPAQLQTIERGFQGSGGSRAGNRGGRRRRKARPTEDEDNFLWEAESGQSKPQSPSFYTGRPVYYDQVIQLQNANSYARSALKSLQLLPLPAFARESMPPLRAVWKTQDEMTADFESKMTTGRYRRVITLLNELNNYLRIATSAGCTDLAQGIGQVVGLFESGMKEAFLSRGRRKQVLLDDQGRSYTVGKRKTSSARVWMIPVRVQPGSSTSPQPKESIEELFGIESSSPPPVAVTASTILVNNIPLAEYFPIPSDRQRIIRPFKVAGVLGAYNVFAIIRGGGSTGQSGALAHGIAKGLAAHEPELDTVLRRAKLMRRDPRMVERKKTGLAKARKRYTWVKR